MNSDPCCNESEDNSRPQSRRIDDTYVLDAITGLYEPKPYASQNQVQHPLTGTSESKPFFVSPRRDILMIVFSLVGLGVSILTLLLLCRTVYWAHQQWEVADRTANSAKEGVEASKRQMRLDERPYLILQIDGGIRVDNGKAFSVPVQMVNFGRTPAYQVEGDAVVEVMDAGREPSLPAIGEHGLYGPGEWTPKDHKQRLLHEFHTGVIYPNEKPGYSFSSVQRQGNKAIPLLVTEKQLEALRGHKAYIGVWGQLWYSDIFGIKHWTKFCMMPGIVPDRMGGQRCADYNDSDRNYDPPK